MIRRIEHQLRAARERLRFRLAQKIILGSAGLPYPGWLLTEKDSLDITNRDSFAQYWKPNSRSIFLAEHVWEHLTEDEVERANANCFEFLRWGGRLRIAVPDGLHPDPEYIEYVRPGGTGAGADDHKVLYNYQLMREQLRKAGFEVSLLEYWDEHRNFHFQEWLSSDGYIDRSKDHDERNQGGTLAYTSLIVDAIKAKRRD
jgi:predicted SAM-dependent methyltransferase